MAYKNRAVSASLAIPAAALLLALALGGCCGTTWFQRMERQPYWDEGGWLFLSDKDIAYLEENGGAHHMEHARRFGRYTGGYNRFVLRGIDRAEFSAPEDGGYFIGIKADPPESPVGYPLELFGRPLLDPPRESSYCSGATYAAFIEALNLIFFHGGQRCLPALDDVHYEAMRMQEPDGGRREDGVKFWGHWNDDGFGSHFALVQYSAMGAEVAPRDARPGDFMNISWTNGGGHSVVFLGWRRDAGGRGHLLYWSSQKGTDGMGDQLVPLERVKSVKVVRLTNPWELFYFDPAAPVVRRIPGDPVDFAESDL